MNPRVQLRSLRKRLTICLQMQYARAAFWLPEAYPDFMCIGAPRAATTWLYHQLRSHPSFFLPKIKELRFFDQPAGIDYDDGTDLLWDETFYFDLDKPHNWRWYSLQFAGSNGRIRGEVTPKYCALSDERIATIKQVIPDLKVVYLIRNPVDVVWSTVRKVIWYQKGEGGADLYSPDDLFRAAMHPVNLRWGDFERNIERWRQRFGDHQILYLFFDDIESNPTAELGRLCDFLGAPRSPLSEPSNLASRVNAAPARRMPDSVRQALQAHFAETVGYLQRKFDRDLRHWSTSG